MAWYRCGGGGIPSSLKGDMNDVFNKKFGTVLQDYPPEDWPGTVNLMGPLPEKTVSGSVVAFSDGADAVLLKSCAVTIAPTLDGVSSVDVVQTGKNLIDWVVSATAFEFILPSGTYTFSVPSGSTIESGNWYFRGFDENGNPYTSRESLGLAQTWTHATGSHWNYSAPTLYRFTFTIPEGCSKLEIFKQNENGNIPAMIEVGSTSTAYEPYVTPTTHTANLGRTIYGGSVDVVNGTGTDEYTFDLWDGTQNYNVSDNLTNVFRIYMNHAKPLPDPTAVQCICEGYTFPRAGWNSDTVSFYSDANNFTLKLPKTEVTTLQEAKAWLTEHNVYFLYATTPENFTFTPVPIISRLGDNTMWSDGDLSVTYRRDIDLALAQ